MTEKMPVIDLAEALNRALGDAEFLKMMLDEFQTTIPDFLKRIQYALRIDDARSLDRESHQLKGAAGNLGAKAIAAAAMELEKLGKSGDLSNGAPALDRLKREIEAFDRNMTEIDWVSLG